LHILFVCPGLSPKYLGHIERIARRYWGDAPFFKRDLKGYLRSIKRMSYVLGLLTLASDLPQGVRCTFVDENAENPRRLGSLYERGDYDLVAVTAQVFQHERVEEIIDHFTGRGVRVVVGGPNATLFPEDYLREGVSVVRGEAENLFKAFLRDMDDGRPRELYQSPVSAEADDGGCVDLGDSPVPDFSLVSRYRYNLTGVQATRGCPHRCRFCNMALLTGSRYRLKPVEQVREEILRVKRFWPDSRFVFHDDNTFTNRDYARELFHALRDIDLGSWATSTDISLARDEDLLNLVASNGRPSICFGLETLARENNGAVGNKLKARYQSRYSEIVRRVRAKGINVFGSFIFGFPGDSRESLAKIMDFVAEHGIAGSIQRLSASPGSLLYDELVAEYEGVHGPLREKGMARARIVNKFYMEKNGFSPRETEDMILEVLGGGDPSRLPTLTIGNLAAFNTLVS